MDDPRGAAAAAIWPYHDLLRDIDPEMLVGADKDAPAEIDPLILERRRQALRIRHGFVHRVAMNPTSDMWRQLIAPAFRSSSASCCATIRPMCTT